MAHWGYGKGFTRLDLDKQLLKPAFQIKNDNSGYVSEGSDPQFIVDRIEFDQKYRDLIVKIIIKLFIFFFAGLFILFFLEFLISILKIKFSKFLIIKFLIFMFPVIYTFALFLAITQGYTFMAWTAKFEGPGENLQAFLYFIGALVAVGIFRFSQNKKIKFLHMLIGFTLLIIFFEETSYLQRVFLIETPQWLTDINLQGETNLHNSKGVNMHAIFKIIGLYGAFSWLLIKYKPFSNLFVLKLLTIPKIASLYMLALFSFYFLFDNQANLGLDVPNVQESFELLLSIAVFIFIIRNFYIIFDVELIIKEKTKLNPKIKPNAPKPFVFWD